MNEIGPNEPTAGACRVVSVDRASPPGPVHPDSTAPTWTADGARPGAGVRGRRPR